MSHLLFLPIFSLVLLYDRDKWSLNTVYECVSVCVLVCVCGLVDGEDHADAKGTLYLYVLSHVVNW